MSIETFDAATTSRVLMQLRSERGWTQEEAAKHCKLSRWAYMQVENGYTAHPRSITLNKIAAGYTISLETLMGQPSLSGADIAALLKQVRDCLDKIEQLARG